MKKGPRPTDWRWGPAQYWYDMLELPEDCPDYDYGLRVVGKEEQEQMDKAVAGIPAGEQVFKMNNFYRTRVRSLFTLVTNSLTHSLTPVK